eukprot:IDg5992t1
MREDSQERERIVFSDECVFCTSSVNAQKEIIGPYFFSEPTLDVEKYNVMLRYYALLNLLALPGSPLFQQDSALPHWSLEVRSSLDRKLGDQWIGRDTLIQRLLGTRFKQHPPENLYKLEKTYENANLLSFPDLDYAKQKLYLSYQYLSLLNF